MSEQQPQPTSRQYAGDHEHNHTDTQLMYWCGGAAVGAIVGALMGLLLGTVVGSKAVMEWSVLIFTVAGIALAIYLERKFRK